MLATQTTTGTRASTGAGRARPTSGRAAPRALAPRAFGGGGGAGGGDASQFTIPEGAAVRVTKPIRVFHAPKGPAVGIPLEGLEGKVVKHAAVHKDGRVLSANLPYRVAFEIPPPSAAAAAGVAGAAEKPIKFQAHLEESELEVVV